MTEDEARMRVILSMCPEKVCRVCGEPSRRIVNDRNGTNRQPIIAAHIRERRKVAGFTVEEVNGWFGYSTGIQHWESDRDDFGRIPNPEDWLLLKERLQLSDDFDETIYGGSLVEYEMLNDNGPKNRGRVTETAMGNLTTRANRIPKDAGFTDCGHDDWRPGLVLDPFAGSGSTLAVATELGRDAIGIDLKKTESAPGR